MTDHSGTTTSHPVVAGRYRLSERLGTGSFGQTWSASDLRLERTVAIRVFEPGRVHLDRDATLLHRLTSTWTEGLTRVLDAGVATIWDDDPEPRGFLVRELVAGECFEQWAADDARSMLDVARAGAAVADVLAALHADDHAHGGTLATNVLVPEAAPDAAGDIVVADFGIAGLHGSASRTCADDVRELGLMLLSALTLRPVYGSRTARAALNSLPKAANIRGIRRRQWVKLLGAMIDDDEAARPAATKVAADLRRLAAESDTHPRPLFSWRRPRQDEDSVWEVLPGA